MGDDRSIPTTAPADRPSFKIMVGGTRISGEYQVQAVVVSRSFNRIAAAEVVILDGDPAAEDFRASSAPDFVPGQEIEIMAGYHEREERLFKGVIVRHGVRATSNRPSVLRIECRDKAVKLAVGRKSAYFYDQKDSEVIEQIASDAGLDVDIEATGATHKQLVQFHASDWDFVVARADANGKLVSTQDGKLVVKAPDAGKDPVLNLRYGGNLLEFEAVADARSQFSAVQAFAWDPANQEMLKIEGAAPAPGAPGNLSSDDMAAVAGLETLELKHGGQLKDTELQAWADAQRLKSAFAKVRGRVRIQGFGAVNPGDVVELGGVGARFNGKALVSGVRHEIGVRNWETDIAFGLAPDWFGQAPDIVDAPANGLLPGIAGLHIGLVTALEGDPDGQERVQVRIPMVDQAQEGAWARIASLDAGNNRGAIFRPEIGDEVVLGFLNEDPRNPVLLGMLHSSAKPAPLPASDDNHQKGIVTRSEIKLLFDDDKKSLTVATPGGNTLVLDDDAGAVTVEDKNGNKLLLNSDGITIESASNLVLKASGDVSIEGANIKASAQSQLKGEGSSGAEISSGGTTVVKGSLVQIN